MSDPDPLPGHPRSTLRARVADRRERAHDAYLRHKADAPWRFYLYRWTQEAKRRRSDALSPGRWVNLGADVDALAGEHDPSDAVDGRCLLRFLRDQRRKEALLLYLMGYTFGEIGRFVLGVSGNYANHLAREAYSYLDWRARDVPLDWRYDGFRTLSCNRVRRTGDGE